MTNTLSVRPEDLIPDGADHAVVDGQALRKGTVAAFLANICIIENTALTEQQKEAAWEALKSLAPAVIQVGLTQFVTFKNEKIEQLLLDAAKA